VSVTTGVRHAADWCVGKKVWLVSGIGNSESFRRLAMENGIQVLGETAFADHHAYRSEDLDRIRAQAKRSNAEIVLTTEKDAGKLAPLLMPDDPWWALRLRADVRRGQDALHRLVRDLSNTPRLQGDVRV
jgi:tetraacyldisaccharide 4'-kinase